MLVCVWSRLASARADDLVLADGGQSAYRIVVADDASPSTRHGAEELQMFLQQITGAKLPIVSDREPLGAAEVILGDNAHLRQLGVQIDFQELGHEGYVLRVVGKHLVIAGGALRGNLYGVYGLLEDHLGCRWFAPDVSRIPQTQRLVLGPIDEKQVPVLEYREPFTFDCFDGDWCARNRVNSSTGRLEAKHGGKIMFGSGFFCHTFAGLVPPDKYFKEHPEYFSLVGGKRQDGYAQLCCTNEDVIRLCTEGILQGMRAHPEAFVFSVSQNDVDKHCECDRCQALAKQEDSQMAPVLALVNRVAEAVEKEFPDKAVETLAYQWTRRPPKSLRPRPNVIIRLCSIECCFAHPLDKCDSPANRAFCQDLEGWAKISDRLWIWDYVTDFSHYLLPFPNQRVRDDNIRLFVRNHVRGIFEQDTYNTPHSELAPLGGYLTAKFLWNPNYDEDDRAERVPGGVLRPGGQARPQLPRPDPRLRREEQHPRRDLGSASKPAPDGRLVGRSQPAVARGRAVGGRGRGRAAASANQPDERGLCDCRASPCCRGQEGRSAFAPASPGGRAIQAVHGDAGGERPDEPVRMATPRFGRLPSETGGGPRRCAVNLVVIPFPGSFWAPACR